MNRLRFYPLLLMVLALIASPAEAQTTDVSGEWDVTIRSPQGPNTVKALLKQEGEKLSGTFRGARGELPLQGTVKGKEIRISYTIKFQDNELPITMTGTIEGNSIKGSADFGGFAQGDWDATRSSAMPSPPVPAGPAGAAVDVSGDWDVTLNSPQGTFNIGASLKQSGETLKGVFTNAQGQLPFEGSIKGNEVKINYTVKFQDNDLPITLTGKVEADAIKGAADFGGFAQGDWNAKRKGAGAAAPAAPAATAGDKVDVTGNWIFQVETAQGSGEPTFTFKQDGEQLTGQYKGVFGEAPLTGTVKGNEITFSIKISVQGNEGVLTYSGTVEKDTIKGKVALGELGSGTFTGRRQ